METPCGGGRPAPRAKFAGSWLYSIAHEPPWEPRLETLTTEDLEHLLLSAVTGSNRAALARSGNSYLDPFEIAIQWPLSCSIIIVLARHGFHPLIDF